MKDFISFDEYDFTFATYDKVVNYASDYLGDRLDLDILQVLSVAFHSPRNLPSILGFKGEIVLKDYVSAWCKKYFNGFNHRPSLRDGKPPSTYPDPIIRILLSSRLPALDTNMLDRIIGGHQLLMAIENLVGDILEEYLSVRLNAYGWTCCWGSTVDAVDFVHADGRLLQVKNSSNSENSSSSRVRFGTEIHKWFRRVASRPNTFQWDIIQSVTGLAELTEEDFRSFAIDLIRNNPGCIYVDDNNPLV